MSALSACSRALSFIVVLILSLSLSLPLSRSSQEAVCPRMRGPVCVYVCLCVKAVIFRFVLEFVFVGQHGEHPQQHPQ